MIEVMWERLQVCPNLIMQNHFNDYDVMLGIDEWQ